MVSAAGEEKALGSNEDARKRAFTIALAEDEVYGAARVGLDGAVRVLLEAEAQFENLERDYNLALMRAGMWRVS